ncbi:MAG: hypothetical protein M1502_04605 [Deltaproteobacteria bacterium]|nr:hypothetical protein [Deltaproteobacteria bacterium]
MKSNKISILDVALIISFNQDNFVRLKQSKAEESYKNIIDKPSTNSNVADTQNPSLPRIYIKDEFKGIAISQSSAQLALIIDQSADLGKQIETVSASIDSMFQDTINFQGDTNIKDTGIIASISVSSNKKPEEISPYMLNTFLNLERQEGDDVVSVMFKTVFKTKENLYMGIDIGPYFNKNAAETGKESLTGYVIKLDINNKPVISSLGNPELVKPDAVKAKFKSFLEEDIYKIFRNLLI